MSDRSWAYETYPCWWGGGGTPSHLCPHVGQRALTAWADLGSACPGEAGYRGRRAMSRLRVVPPPPRPAWPGCDVVQRVVPSTHAAPARGCPTPGARPPRHGAGADADGGRPRQSSAVGRRPPGAPAVTCTPRRTPRLEPDDQPEPGRPRCANPPRKPATERTPRTGRRGRPQDSPVQRPSSVAVAPAPPRPALVPSASPESAPLRRPSQLTIAHPHPGSCRHPSPRGPRPFTEEEHDDRDHRPHRLRARASTARPGLGRPASSGAGSAPALVERQLVALGC